MLEIGQERLGMTLDEWNANQELRKEYKSPRDYINYLFGLS